jgi:RNA 3'-terminal phosphate cyclase
MKTSIWVIEKFLGEKFTVEYGEKNVIVGCSGAE